MNQHEKRSSNGLQPPKRGRPKIYHVKSNKKRPWMVSWRHEGKRQRWTYETEKEAQDKLDELETVLEAEGLQGVRFGAVARAEWNAANQILEPFGVSVIEAARYYGRMHTERAHRIPWPDAVQSLREEMEAANRKEITIKGKARMLNIYARHLNAKTLADLTPDNIRDFLRRPGLTAQSVLSYRAALSVLGNHAKRRGWLKSNPVEDIQKPTVDASSPDVLTARECNAYLAVAYDLEGGRLLKQVCLRLLAGLRPNEAESIQPEHILEDGIRVAVGKKRGRRSVRIVEISPAFRAWWAIAEQKKSPLHPTNLKNLRPKAIDLAGITKVKKDLERHTWISCALATIHDENKVARMAGNSPQIIYTNYYQLLKEDEAARVGISSPIDTKPKKEGNQDR